MGKDNLAGFLVLLVHGEVHHKAELKAVLIDQLHPLGHFLTDHPRQPGGFLLAVRNEVEHAVRLQLTAVFQLQALVVV